MPRKTGAETGLTHTKRLFRVKLTPCFPVVVELARPHAGREPKYRSGLTMRERGLASTGAWISAVFDTIAALH